MRTRPARLPAVLPLLLLLGAGVGLADEQPDARPAEPSAGSSVPTDDQVGEAVEISFRVQDTRVRILRVRRLRGSRQPMRKADQPTHRVRILGRDGASLKVFEIAPPTEVFGAPLRSEDEVGGRHAKKHASKVEMKEFAITVELPEGAHTLQLLDAQAGVIDEKRIPPGATRPKKRDTKKIEGSEVLRRRDDSGAQRMLRDLEDLATGVGDAVVGRAHAQASPRVLTIAFIGDMYGDSAEDRGRFESDVDRVVETLVGVEPFDCHADALVFQLVHNADSLGCAYSLTVPRLLVCNDAKVTAAVNDAEIPYDYIAVLVNSTGYGGSGGAIPVSYNGADAPKVFLHEFGHGFAGLKDEYERFATDGVTADRVEKNCFLGSPPAAAWNGIVDSSGYHRGCDHPNWYRSSLTSIMRTIAPDGFNLVSRNIIEARILSDLGAPPAVVPCGATPPTPPMQAPVLLSD